MKKIKITLFILALLSILSSLCGCFNEGVSLNNTDGNKTANVVVFSYKDEESSIEAKIKSGLYAFILSDKKTDFLYLLSQYQENANSQITVMDNEAFWNTVPDKEDGRSYKELVEADITSYCKRLVVTKVLCQKYGISVTKNEDTKKEIETLVQNHINAYGDKDSMNSYLYRFGITSDDLFQYYEMQYYVQALENYYYGTGGKTPIDSSLVQEKFLSDWAKVKSIYISYTEPENKLPEENKSNASDESKESIEIDGIRTKEKAIKFATELYDSIKNGEVEFDSKYSLSEDGISEYFPNGHIIQKGTSSANIDKAIFEMKENELRLVEGDSGVYIILKKQLSEKDIDEYYEDIEQTFIDEKYAELIEEYYGFVSMNNDELKKYNIVSADIYDWK